MKNLIRIIVSDDSQTARAGLIALLQSFRTNPERITRLEVVGEAKNGEEAVRLSRDLNPDVIFMDARMPVMDGIEATRIIKTQIRNTKVVVMSIYPGYRKSAYEAGADLFLEKGVVDININEIILSLLS